MKIIETKEGSVLEVCVKPNSKEFRIVAEGDEIIVFCREDPVKGKVNKELLNGFSRLFHKKVELVSGFTSKQKRVLIRGVAKSDVAPILLRR
jgi:hypothetical protein